MSEWLRKRVSLILIAMLVFAPMDALYASNMISCDDMQMTAGHGNNLDQASQAQQQNKMPSYAFCAEHGCNCDMDACSCAVVVFNLFANVFPDLTRACATGSSLIPFFIGHAPTHDFVPLLRPPIA